MDSASEAARWAEDDSLRSRFIRQLVQTNQCIPGTLSPKTNEIPKVIVQYWNDLSTIPGDVQECVASWAPLEAQGFTQMLIDDEQARALIVNEFGDQYAKAYDRCHHPAMRCDYFRLCYILLHGGFYIDADEVYRNVDCQELLSDGVLKLHPLCYEISSDSMIKIAAFRDAKNVSSDWIFYVNNNPLIAPAHHPLIRMALERATAALLASERPLEIQSTTGPGNLSACLVQHAIGLQHAQRPYDFAIVQNWDEISISRWPLSYRNDQRNWRRWKPPEGS